MTERVLLSIIAVLIWLIMDVWSGTRGVHDLIATAISAALVFNVAYGLGRHLR